VTRLSTPARRTSTLRGKRALGHARHNYFCARAERPSRSSRPAIALCICSCTRATSSIHFNPSRLEKQLLASPFDARTPERGGRGAVFWESAPAGGPQDDVSPNRAGATAPRDARRREGATAVKMSSLDDASRSIARAASTREDATRDGAATIRKSEDIFVRGSASKAASNARERAREREDARAMKAGVVCGGDGRAGTSRRARGRERRRDARRLLEEASASTSRASDTGADARASADARAMVKNEALLARERECAVRDEIWATRLEHEETTGYDFEATLDELWTDWWWKMSRGERLSAEKSSVMDMLTAIVNGTSSRDMESGVRRVSVADASESSDCPVCLEDDDDARADVVRLTRCEHTFHIDCIAPWLQRHKTCPKCRASVR